MKGGLQKGPTPTGGRPVVCWREIVNEQGAGTVYYVMLEDGYLLDCGYGHGAEARAADVQRRLSA